MKVGDFFKKLSYGELSNLAIGKEGEGLIEPDDQNKIISYTNTALTSLYSRFSHKKDYVKLTLDENVNRYNIEESVSNLIKILSIKQEDDPNTEINEEKYLRIQVHPRLGGIKLMSYNEIYVPEPETGVDLTIEYQANHDPLSIPPDSEEIISVAPMLEEALEMRVAARVWGSMAGEAHQLKAQSLMKRYNHLLYLADTEDVLQESENATIDKLRDKGFE